MALMQKTVDESGTVTISVPGRFDFSVHKAFRDTYRDTPGEEIAYCVDLRDTEYMDSSALGMLLLLREHAGGDKARVRLVNASEAVKKVLEIANFHRLFQID